VLQVRWGADEVGGLLASLSLYSTPGATDERQNAGEVAGLARVGLRYVVLVEGWFRHWACPPSYGPRWRGPAPACGWWRYARACEARPPRCGAAPVLPGSLPAAG